MIKGGWGCPCIKVCKGVGRSKEGGEGETGQKCKDTFWIGLKTYFYWFH